jgi:transcriptional regulator with XRE-family HTH domain
MEHIETCGQRVRRLREAKQLSQRGLGKLVGCEGPTIADLETWKTKFPSARVLQKMCEVFGKSDRYILYGEDGEITVPTPAQQEILGKLAKLSPEQHALAMSLIDQLIKTQS